MIVARRLASTKPKQGADSIPANCLELPYWRSFFLPTLTVVDSVHCALRLGSPHRVAPSLERKRCQLPASVLPTNFDASQSLP